MTHPVDTPPSGSSAVPAWRDDVHRQLAFGSAGVLPAGAAWLDDDGRPDPAQGQHTWLTSRMVHVFSLGALLDVEDAGTLAEQALAGLTGPLHDDEHGGWFAGIAADGTPEDTKAAYPHAFVLLAASSAVVAGVPGAREVLDEVTRLLDTRFVDTTGLAAERWDRTFSTLDAYRGVNANMHLLEASLAAWDATADARHLERATGIGEQVVAWAAARSWRVPEHFTAAAAGAAWVERPEHHRDEPAHPFEPFGATVGHGLEWSRLVLQLDAALAGAGRPPVLDAVLAARGLYDRAVTDGWARDGADGFVYTTDWAGSPVVRTRMHWVVAEAVCAAAALGTATGDPRLDADLTRWRAHAEQHWIDPVTRTWAHELDEQLRPARTVWSGRPDLYHSVHAALLPHLPAAPTAARALSDAARTGVLPG